MTPPAGAPATTPPYLLRTPRLLLRCLEPSDAARRQDAVDSSGAFLENLFPPGLEGRLSLDAHAAQIRDRRGRFDLDQDRFHGAFEPETGRMLGETGLLKRAGIGALEISYWIRADVAGQGIATEMASAMVKLAFEFDRVKRLDLICTWDNERSAAMARRLGFTFEGRLRDRQLAPHHPRGDVLCFTLLASEYPQTQAHPLPLEAFDFLGRRLAGARPG